MRVKYMGDIGWAVDAMRMGRKVRRVGWNGKGMWLALSPGNDALPSKSFWSDAAAAFAKEQPGGKAKVLPCIIMKTATGEILMGWLASQTDLLAVDWEEAT